MIEFPGKYTTAKVMIDALDEETARQITQFVNHPAFTNPVAIMPDTHAGKGAVIGFTMELTDKVIPNVIGVDIGCGMMSLNLGKKLNFDMRDWGKVDLDLRRRLPFGFDVRKTPALNVEREFPWTLANASLARMASLYNKRFETKHDFRDHEYNYRWLCEKVKSIEASQRRVENSLGTLGGGNHFIEFSEGLSSKTNWVTVHTGSRNFGLRVANYWQRKAYDNVKRQYTAGFETEVERIKAEEPKEKWNELIRAAKKPPAANGLEWLEGEDAFGYLVDMHFAQFYAMQNRLLLINDICDYFNIHPTERILLEVVQSVHNYISFDDFIVRKGAISSYAGRKMIIPFNMEDGILICDGKSNSEWNFSAPHGAGRISSRKAAKTALSGQEKEIKKRMKEKGTYISLLPLDEAKEAYKDPKVIEDAIGPTAAIVDRLRPVLNMKDK